MSEESKQLEGGALLTDGTRKFRWVAISSELSTLGVQVERKAPDPTPPESALSRQANLRSWIIWMRCSRDRSQAVEPPDHLRIRWGRVDAVGRCGLGRGDGGDPRPREHHEAGGRHAPKTTTNWP